MFPVTNRAEMRSGTGNELALIPDSDMRGIWSAIMRRLGEIPEYRGLFQGAYPGTKFSDMTFAHASNAIAGFIVSEYSFTNSPWDRFLAGNPRALSREQLLGARTFLSLRCVQCHTGPTFSDQRFHNVALAQFGPGKTANGDDEGRRLEDGAAASRYAFRTTPLRNLAVTAPYGHAGQLGTVRAFVEHYSESDVKLRDYIATQDGGRLEALYAPTLRHNAEEILATRDPILDGVVLPADVVDRLVTYMDALNDPDAHNLRNRIPGRVPSGLPVARLK
jgi:cytochrome c peroxidase